MEPDQHQPQVLNDVEEASRPQGQVTTSTSGAYLMTTVAPLVAAVVAGLAARLAGEGPLGGISGSHAEKEHFFGARARAPP